ncbi:MAG: SAF domain-containing protein [Nocardioidaceae bacterium]
MAEPRLLLRRWRRAVLRQRRLIVAVLLAASVMAFAEHVRPDPPVSTAVVVAAHDLEAGTRIGPDDVQIVSMPRAIVPHAAATSVGDVTGSTVAGPMRAGEPMTDKRLVGTSLIAGYPPGWVAAPVRVADAEAAALLAVGDRVDVYAAQPTKEEARLLVSSAPVVSVPRTEHGSSPGALVVLAVDDVAAAALAGASDGAVVSVVMRR